VIKNNTSNCDTVTKYSVIASDAGTGGAEGAGERMFPQLLHWGATNTFCSPNILHTEYPNFEVNY